VIAIGVAYALLISGKACWFSCILGIKAAVIVGAQALRTKAPSTAPSRVALAILSFLHYLCIGPFFH
jgi:hypothetical protein